MSVEMLSQLRERMMPMLRLVADEYRSRVPDGYPVVVDAVDRGVFGLEIDPSYALYVTSDRDGLFVDYYWRSSRYDSRSSAMREKFSGSPVYDRRPVSPNASDVELRNMIAELMARHNYQQGLVHISDSSRSGAPVKCRCVNRRSYVPRETRRPTLEPTGRCRVPTSAGLDPQRRRPAPALHSLARRTRG